MGEQAVLEPAVQPGEPGQAAAAQEPGVEQVFVQVGEDQCGNEPPAGRQDTEGLAEEVAGFGDVLQDREGEDGAEPPIAERKPAAVRLHQRDIAASRCRPRQGPSGEVHPHVHPIAQGGQREFSRSTPQIQQGASQAGRTDLAGFSDPVHGVRQRAGGQVSIQHLSAGFHRQVIGPSCRPDIARHNHTAGLLIHR